MKNDDFVLIPNKENKYEINKNGIIRNFKTKRILTHCISSKGYIRINLMLKGKESSGFLHKLLAETFIENPNNYECVDHIDGNKKNNTLENLRWCSIQLNNSYYSKNNPLHISKLTREVVLDIYNNYNHRGEKSIAMKKYNVSPETIRLIKKGVRFKEITNII